MVLITAVQVQSKKDVHLHFLLRLSLNYRTGFCNVVLVPWWLDNFQVVFIHCAAKCLRSCSSYMKSVAVLVRHVGPWILSRSRADRCGRGSRSYRPGQRVLIRMGSLEQADS